MFELRWYVYRPNHHEHEKQSEDRPNMQMRCYNRLA